MDYTSRNELTRYTRDCKQLRQAEDIADLGQCPFSVGE